MKTEDFRVEAQKQKLLYVVLRSKKVLYKEDRLFVINEQAKNYEART